MTRYDDLDVARGVVFACRLSLPVWAGLICLLLIC
jgi:hypothetical protein